MKFSIRQILASTAGAVCAAIIASLFGVKGTIVGVAIGSAAATMATAFVAQSIERGHEAVKQVAVRAPETSSLLRRLGGTRASGPSSSSVDASSAPTEVVGRSEPRSGSAHATVEMASTPAPAGEAERLEISATADTPGTQRLRATATPPRPAPAQVARRARPQGFSWRAIAGTVAVVFVLALLFITAVELISGKPLSAIFGGADTGTTVKNLVNPSPAPTTTPTSTPASTTSTTSTTSASSTTTTTTAGATTTTSTTAPKASATTTTPTTAPATTTTGPGLNGSTTTTSVSSAT